MTLKEAYFSLWTRNCYFAYNKYLIVRNKKTGQFKVVKNDDFDSSLYETGYGSYDDKEEAEYRLEKGQRPPSHTRKDYGTKEFLVSRDKHYIVRDKKTNKEKVIHEKEYDSDLHEIRGSYNDKEDAEFYLKKYQRPPSHAQR